MKVNNRWLTFEEARKIVRKDAIKYKISGWDKWQDVYIKDEKFPKKIPKQPHLFYKNKGWISWGDWLGTNRVANEKRFFLSFEKALKVIRRDAKRYNITRNTWTEYCKTKKPLSIPSNPYSVYKNKGWISFGHWLGTKNVYNGFKEFLSFEEAFSFIKEDIKKYNIINKKKWYEYCNSKYKPNNIPSNPDNFYKNNGWVSWGNWLRTNSVRGGQRKYSVNEDFFKVWSHDMAYILGFWWADGNMSSERGRYNFSICQHVKDKYILLQILKVIGSNHLLHRSGKRNYCHFSISSKSIYNDILSLGGLPKKSLVIGFPNIPEKYLPDFIRGYFDGDGSISIYDKKYYSANCSFSSGSKIMLEGLKKSLKDNYKIIGEIVWSGGCFKLIFKMEDTIRLYQIMYNRYLKLERKYKKFNMLINYRKKKYGRNWKWKQKG